MGKGGSFSFCSSGLEEELGSVQSVTPGTNETLPCGLHCGVEVFGNVVSFTT